MNNVVLTSACQITEESGVPLAAAHYDPAPVVPEPEPEPEPVATETTETPVENPPETEAPTEQTDVDGNFQAHMDINYQAHDIALAAAKTNGHDHTNGLKAEPPHQKLDIDDGSDHPEKVKPCWLMLNKFLLAMAIICFALFLGAVALIVSNQGHVSTLRESFYRTPPKAIDGFRNDQEYNLTSAKGDGMIVVIARRGGSIKDILIPYTDSNNQKQYRSVVLKGDQLGAVRFGFDEEIKAFDLKNQLPSDYPFLNYDKDDWSASGESHLPNSIHLVNGIVEVIYEFSSERNELMMRTIVSPGVNEQIVVDPTNNVYFNLRGKGDLSTHYLNVTSFNAYNIQTSESNDKQQIASNIPVAQLADVQNYFYRLTRAGIGKLFVGTLSESETNTKISIFADRAGVTIDPSGLVAGNENMTIPDMYGVRLSPRQSPVYQTNSNYGPTLVVYPSQAIHTTWWKFEY